ncbi:MAG: S1/P1 nuclease [Bacteroidales bacterium]|nr:S1/P1 nuclease [Bacteroidales bacterium]MBP5521958.1 S1/P1 nuclease [Bacteroidales bacterium]
MKKLFLVLLLSVCATLAAEAWAGLGHKTVIAVAQRHLTSKTQENIARYFDYDLKQDATWMDAHRRDDDIGYTTAWHVYSVDGNHNYDPNPRLAKGDAIHALQVVDYNLRHYKELSDSAVIMNVRMLIHFVGDMHCPVHCYFPGAKNNWPCKLNGEEIKSFHTLYDAMPSRLWPDLSPDELAAQLDNCGACKRNKIAKGTPVEWARATGDRCAVIYEINPQQTKDLDPDTAEKSRELVSLQLRDAGYRLARLLNFYFGK